MLAENFLFAIAAALFCDGAAGSTTIEEYKTINTKHFIGKLNVPEDLVNVQNFG